MPNYTPAALADFQKMQAASRTHMRALADLVNMPSREFKQAPDRDWIDRDQVMRLIAPLRDNALALATMLRDELARTHGVLPVEAQSCPRCGARSQCDAENLCHGEDCPLPDTGDDFAAALRLASGVKTVDGGQQ